MPPRANVASSVCLHEAVASSVRLHEAVASSVRLHEAVLLGALATSWLSWLINNCFITGGGVHARHGREPAPVQGTEHRCIEAAAVHQHDQAARRGRCSRSSASRATCSRYSGTTSGSSPSSPSWSGWPAVRRCSGYPRQRARRWRKVRTPSRP